MADGIPGALREIGRQNPHISGAVNETADEIERLRAALNECLIILDDGDYGEDPGLREVTDRARALLFVNSPQPPVSPEDL